MHSKYVYTDIYQGLKVFAIYIYIGVGLYFTLGGLMLQNIISAPLLTSVDTIQCSVLNWSTPNRYEMINNC